ncbi:PDZ domain-containing protein [Pseudarthrobacter sp. IC2-21]|uniref:YlbL family protein n=1 Tax=Pseudarthrobacter sp. IC2-21 TaxID=3092262 RepID=UPI0039BC3E97
MTATRGEHPHKDHSSEVDDAATVHAGPPEGPAAGVAAAGNYGPPNQRTGDGRVSVMLLSGVLAVGLGIAAATIPVPYVVERAGPTFNTLDRSGDTPVISVTGHETYPAKGNLDLTTVYVEGGPTGPVSIVGVFGAWLDRSKSVYPQELIYPTGTTKEQAEEQSSVAMTTSQENAVASALRELNIPFGQQLQAAGLSNGSPSAGKVQDGDIFETINGKPITSLTVVQEELAAGKGAPVTLVVQRAGESLAQTITPKDNGSGRYILGIMLKYVFTFPFDVKISLDKVGGPSAGLMFALGIVDTVTPGDLTGGKHIAGTGTISPDGTVGPIGGIRQKMLGARAGGATLFLAPADNCDEVAGNVPEGLQVVKVENLDQARSAVERAASSQDTAGLPSCASN